MPKSWEDLAKDLEKLGADVDAAFSDTAAQTSIEVVNYAKEFTKNAGLVDTGTYRRSWAATSGKTEKNTHYVELVNPMEYAMALERGYTVKKTHFVPFDKLKGNKSKALIQSIKSKNPKAKGFIVKAGKRFKGHFVGKLSIEKAEKFAIKFISDAIDEVMK